jgi:diaminopimelate epimerase
MRFAKGHGTENDFVIIPDPDGTIELTPGLVARLCDRRAGLGADGVLRAVRVTASADEHGPGLDAGYDPGAAAEAGAEWFMDYRNADGSVAEMCGNGVRVFGRYLLDHDLVAGPEFALATRAGIRMVRAEPDGELTVDMGQPQLLGPARATLAGQPLDGLRVSLGNPHLACLVDGPLAEFDLSQPPEVDAGQFPDGVNLELVRIVGQAHIVMGVHERGSGPTRSCGTGAVAAAAAAAVAAPAAAGPAPPDATLPPDGSPRAADDAPPAAGRLPAYPSPPQAAAVPPPGTWIVDVPGGRLRVTLDGQTSFLSGPAVIVAEGELAEAWLSGKPVTPEQSPPAA